MACAGGFSFSICICLPYLSEAIDCDVIENFEVIDCADKPSCSLLKSLRFKLLISYRNLKFLKVTYQVEVESCDLMSKYYLTNSCQF